MNENLMIFGTGAHARKAFHCWTLAGGAVSAFVDENPAVISPILGVPVMSSVELDGQVQAGLLFVAIGSAEPRRRLMDHYAQRGWRLPALVHPHASVAPDAILNEGVIIAACAVIESGSIIGRGAIIDIGVIIDHDCQVAEFCHLRPGQVCQNATEWPA